MKGWGEGRTRYGKYAANFLLNHYQLIALCRLQCEMKNARRATRKRQCTSWLQLGKKILLCWNSKKVNESIVQQRNRSIVLINRIFSELEPFLASSTNSLENICNMLMLLLLQLQNSENCRSSSYLFCLDAWFVVAMH